MVVAVRAESIGDAVVGAPRMKVGEERVVDALGDLGVAEFVGFVADGLAQVDACAVASNRSGSHAVGEHDKRRLVETAVGDGVEHFLFGWRVRQVRAGRAVGRDGA